jgi:ribonuclease HI
MYTDGSSKGNPGPGGYGVVLICEGKRKEISKGFRRTTNNRMELMAVIAGLSALKVKCNVMIYSDSKYVVEAINKGWLRNWYKKGWMLSSNKPVLNVDLWKKLLELLERHNVKFVWIKGHDSNKENHRCDDLAVTAAEGSNLNVDVVYEKEKESISKFFGYIKQIEFNLFRSDLNPFLTPSLV